MAADDSSDRNTRPATLSGKPGIDGGEAVAPPKKPLPLRELAEFRASMPRLKRSSAEVLRELRDEGL